MILPCPHGWLCLTTQKGTLSQQLMFINGSLSVELKTWNTFRDAGYPNDVPALGNLQKLDSDVHLRIQCYVSCRVIGTLKDLEEELAEFQEVCSNSNLLRCVAGRLLDVLISRRIGNEGGEGGSWGDRCRVLRRSTWARCSGIRWC